MSESDGSRLATTWWGHSSVSVEIDRSHVLTDPLLVDRLFHLSRQAPTPAPRAAEASVVLISHLHADHLHLPSLRRVRADAPILVPRGASGVLRSLRGREVLEVEPGDSLEVAGLAVHVLGARHSGRRHPFSRARGPALGFRVAGTSHSMWFPGDTGPHDAFSAVEPVDLALVPIGGWGPSLGREHLNPDQAAAAVRAVGARWAVPVHHGTFWPLALRHLDPARHHRLFVSPGPRFLSAMAAASPETTALLPAHGERVVLEEQP
ncbi:MBL fold metallo-hydrolase [Aeromicrobium sp. CTD01-1L150]|uniref:MBL fold metallo-hydrolase n=1 Tax=Aeromicrobium sp. CTD01-1L150 TaxID=3341830 RepID=UPI0035C0197B